MQSWQTCGLLSGACRPEAERGAVRAYWRHRAAHIQHMPKALHKMNVQ
jgi:hypothetical protein